MDPMFEDLSASLLNYVETQLAHDEDSDDDELLVAFVEEGLTEEQARHALTYRDQYSGIVYLPTQTPIRLAGLPRQTGTRSKYFSPDY